MKMKNKKELKELKKIEKEVKKSELEEALNLIESRRNFNLGLILGLVFAVIAGFFSIIVHEIFIEGLSYLTKVVISCVAFVFLVLFLILGLHENKKNKILRKKMFEHLKK